ncbi:hypothetical protein [Lacisediminimonas sp.]|uniref:hypothetical protein n=1 Tax=Lacisediminimonas sp. TaxID=3060582 RepID=UPI0027214B4D|nr:hypothetical protein [Lacisediminimonas sp.]MDO8300790.1 hypothetical protein [Lacisediminimonas sp.]MDO9219198.1 hypothetical protein [Lacisediminimonas sp.]
MLKITIRAGRFSCVALTCWTLLACTPPLDWREVRVTETPYVVLMPAKPTAHTRTVKLDATDLAMTMRGAEVEGVTYAVGTVTLPDEARAASAARALQAALVRNMGGAVRQEKQLIVSGLPVTAIQVDGKNARGEAIRLHARFAARGPFAYQAVVLGAAAKVRTEAADIFLDSFRPGQQ